MVFSPRILYSMLGIRQVSLFSFTKVLHTGSQREGVILCLEDGKGKRGWGEASPFPLFGKETKEDVLEQLECLGRGDPVEAPFPSVVFAWDSALSYWRDPAPQGQIPISALLWGDRKQIFTQAAKRASQGYKTVKVKLSSLSFAEARQVLLALHPYFSLRVDVNRAWTRTESLAFFSYFPSHFFSYVEEPFDEPRRYAEFPFPIAIDESWMETLSWEDMAHLPNMRALIYKPTLRGGEKEAECAWEWTRRRGVQLVLSSSIESPVGLHQIGRLARRLGVQEPLGIDTLSYFQDSTEDSIGSQGWLQIENGDMDLSFARKIWWQDVSCVL